MYLLYLHLNLLDDTPEKMILRENYLRISKACLIYSNLFHWKMNMPEIGKVIDWWIQDDALAF